MRGGGGAGDTLLPDLEFVDLHVWVQPTLEAAGGGRRRGGGQGTVAEGKQGSGRLWRGEVRGAYGAEQSNRSRVDDPRSMHSCRIDKMRSVHSCQTPRDRGRGLGRD